MLKGFLSQSVWLKIRWIALWCCLFFTISAFAQLFFSKQQLHEQIETELGEWAKDISHEIGLPATWDVRRYDRIAPKVPSYAVLTNADFVGFYRLPPGLIRQVSLPGRVAGDRLETVTTVAGRWRIYVKTLSDGYVILGIDNPEGEKSDTELLEDAQKFGISMNDALKVEPHDTSENISYAVIDSFNNLKSGIGALPVRTVPNILEYPRRTARPVDADDGRRYMVLYEPLFDSSGKQNGLVIVPKDIELEERIGRNQLVLILIVTGITWSFFLFQVVYSWKKTEAEKSAFRQRIEGYFSPPVLEDILKEGRTLEGERREVAILFADIRSFTSLSEKLPPIRLIELLREYFTEMTAEILAENGVVDKFIGDAIMAFWGAPLDQLDKADRAVRTALRMIERLATLNEKWTSEGYPRWDIGIGVNTGVAIVGNVGSRTRFDYTLVGDEVNVASRLEGLTKQFGGGIIISESTKKNLTVPLNLESLGEVEIRGRREPVEIYRVNQSQNTAT